MHQVSRIEVRRIVTPAPVPDENIPANATPASPPGAQSPNNESEHSVSAETVEENREHNIMEQNPRPRLLHQQPLKSRSEPISSTRNPEWELSQERLAAQSVGLRAPPASSCHSFVLGGDDLLTGSTLVGGMYNGHDMPWADPSLAASTVHTPCNGGRACDDLPHYRRHEQRSESSSRATVQTRVYAPAPVAPLRGVVDNSQDHRISFEDMDAPPDYRHEDTGVASETAEAPVLRSPHDSATSDRVPQRSTRWDQNIKKNRCSRWLWLVLPDLCLLVSLFLAAIFMEKYLDIFRWMTRTFPMTWDPRTSTWVGPVEISWPKEDFIVPVLTAEILIPLIPTVVLLAMQIWVRSVWDFNAAIFGLFKGIAIVTLLQVILKSFIGEFRPHFMSVCNPQGKRVFGDPTLSPAIRFVPVSECPAIKSAIRPNFKRAPQGGNYVSPDLPRWIIARTAETKALRFATQSFPSGHTMEAFCVGTFLSLYLNAKLKACSDYHTSFWKLLVVLSPIVGAAFIAASVAVDHNHHFHDVVLSIPLGVLVGLLAYRTHYMSIFNYHTNHLYLPWSSLHRSINLTAPTVPIARDAKPSYRFKSKYRHKTAVAWPRRPETQGWDRGQETGTVGLDGTGDGKPGRSRRSRLPQTLKKGKTRQSMFPVRRTGSIDAVRSNDCISPMAEGPPLRTPATRAAKPSTPRAPPNSAATGRDFDSPVRDMAPAMTPDYSIRRGPPNNAASAATGRDFDLPGRDVAPAMTPNTRGAERVAVDDWLYGGRPSDMV